MSKEEFLKTLGRRLAQTLPQDQVTGHIRYYDQYIEEQKAAGRTEQQVLEELGDPLLIARTIMDTSPEEPQSIWEESQNSRQGYEESENEYGTSGKLHTVRIDTRVGCLVAAIVFILIAAFVLWLVGSVLSLILPVLVPVLLLGYVLSILHNRR